MPGLPMPVLNTCQVIVGVDPHTAIPPVPPAVTPHVVVWMTGLSQKMNFMGLSQGISKANSPETLGSKGCANGPVTAGWGYACAQGHDSGMHPAHIAGNALLPVVMLGSSSKAEFASGTVRTPMGNMAVGCLYAVNLQLHCGDPVALPTGVAITAANTVRAGFTWGDFFTGFSIKVSSQNATLYIINFKLGYKSFWVYLIKYPMYFFYINPINNGMYDPDILSNTTNAITCFSFVNSHPSSNSFNDRLFNSL